MPHELRAIARNKIRFLNLYACAHTQLYAMKAIEIIGKLNLILHYIL